MSGDCDPCNSGRGQRRQGFNPENPNDLADQLDRGNGKSVADALMRDAYTMGPERFKQTVLAVAQRENPNYGDNLAVSRQGEIYISRDDGRSFRIGNIYNQREMAREFAINHNLERNDGNHGREIPRRPVLDPRMQPEPYYAGQDNGYYQPGIATPPYYPEHQRHGRNGRVFQPGYGNQGQDIIRDGVQGAIIGEISGGKPLKGAIANIGLGLLLNGRRY